MAHRLQAGPPHWSALGHRLRLVAELTERGWLQRDEARRVRLGVQLWEVAARASSALSLREAAMPMLEDLHAQVRQHAQLGVLDGTEVLFLQRLSAPEAVVNFEGRDVSPPGREPELLRDPS